MQPEECVAKRVSLHWDCTV